MDSKSLIIYDCEDFKVRLEYNQDYVVLHLPTVQTFSKSILVKMQNKVIELLDFFYELGYNGIWAGCHESSNQTKRLIGLLGFEYFKDQDGLSIYNIGVK